MLFIIFLFKINEKLELTIDSDSTYYSSGTKMTTTQEAVKATDNVVSMFIIRNGQTAARSLWIIKTDGNIYRIKYKRSEATGVDAGYYDIHNLEKYEGKNIVYIADTAPCHRQACSGYDGPTFIDIEGNIYGADELVELK